MSCFTFPDKSMVRQPFCLLPHMDKFIVRTKVTKPPRPLPLLASGALQLRKNFDSLVPIPKVHPKFLRPLPGRWGQGRGGPESGDLDTLSYPSRGRDFDLNLVHDFADRSLSAMPSAQQRRKIFASATMKPDRVVRSRGRSGMGSNIAWHRRHNDSVD